MELQLLLADSYGPVAAGRNNLGVANALALNWVVTPLIASFNHADPEKTIDPAL